MEDALDCSGPLGTVPNEPALDLGWVILYGEWY